MLKDKALPANHDPKDNEDINPRGRKYPVKGLGMLPTWCNLRLVQAENTPEGTGQSYFILLYAICFNYSNQILIQTERETIFSFITTVSCSL